MPKGGLQHIFAETAPSVDFFISLTYNESVYFNEREKRFKVAPRGIKEDGYVKCVEMRRFWPKAEDYDNRLRNYIALNREDC